MASKKLRVGIGQMDCELGDLQANLEKIESIANDAADQGCDIVVYPELATSGYAVGMDFADCSIQPGGAELDRLRRLSRRIGVVLGFIEETEDTEFYNSAMFLYQGRICHVHRKVYLPNYRIFDERRYYGSGLTIRAFDTPWGRMAMLICGDAWHVSMPYLATHDGADVLLVMAASSDQGLSPDVPVRDAWRRLNLTYALTMNNFVVFSNRVGTEQMRDCAATLEFWGGSHVCHPCGRMMSEALISEEDLTTADLDLSELRAQRIMLPFRRDDSIAFTMNVGRQVLRAKAERRHGVYGLVGQEEEFGDPAEYIPPTPGDAQVPPDQSIS